MSVRDYLRIKILGSSLVIPNTNDLIPLLKYEMRNSFMFLLYIAFVVVIVVSSIFIGIRRNKKTYLLYILGFSLIYCAFILQKGTSIQPKNKKKASFLIDKKSEKGRSSMLTTFLAKTKVIYKKAEGLIGIDKKSMLHGGRRHKKSHLRMVEVTNEDLNFPEAQQTHVQYLKSTPMCVPLKVNTTESRTINLKEVDCLKKDTNLQNKAIITDSTIDYLNKLQEVFIDYKENTINLKKFINRLSEIEKRTKEEMTRFKINFDEFIKQGKVIETEMLGFNAPIRFLNSEYENLVNEVDKYFYLTRNLKDEKYNPIPLIYIENILKTRKVLDSSNNENIINTDRIYKHIYYIKILVMILTLLVIANFVVLILDITALQVFVTPLLCFIFCLFIFSSVIILLDAQLLDRNCKTGTVKDCNFDLENTNDYIDNIRRTEFLTQSEIFKTDIEESLKGSERATVHLNNYVNSLMKDRLNEKIGVFQNLFDKIIFVNENFDDLTKHKVDSNIFYSNIQNMIRSLDTIKNIFSENIKEDSLKLYSNEVKYYYFVAKQKNEVVSKTKSIILGKQQRKSNHKVRECLSILENVCRTRDKLDEMFVFITIFTPILLFCIIL